MVFVPMTRYGQDYQVSIPALQPDAESVEYRIVVMNRDNLIYSSRKFEIEIHPNSVVVPSNAGPTTVYAEICEVPDSLHGFSDLVVVASIDCADDLDSSFRLSKHLNSSAATALSPSKETSSNKSAPQRRWIRRGAIAAGAAAVVWTLTRDKDRPPRFADPSPLELDVPENTTGNIDVPVTATDPDGDTITYTLSGTDASLFRVDADAQLSVPESTNLDFERREEFSFQVDATARGVVASRSVAVSVTDIPEPPGRIDATGLTNVTETTVVIGWLEPDNQGPRINDYDVQYREPELEWLDHELSGTSKTTEIANLAPGTEYEYQVRAVNDEGAGEWSESTTFETLEPESPDLFTDWQALVALYKATVGENWDDNENWRIDGDTPTADELNTFYGVYVQFGRVVVLNLASNNLDGELPPELNDLAGLRRLDLRSNLLSGSLPSELGGLGELTKLILLGNELIGSIPESFGDLSNLFELDLGSNLLSGEIPSSLGNLRHLIYLRLDANEISGAMPAELGALENVVIMNFSNNNLNGQIPPELGDLNLLCMFLNNNQFTGEIPPELGNMINLNVLDLSYNDLTGTIPDELWDLDYLDELFLNNNSLTGEVPSGIEDQESLVEFDISGNSLTGELPHEMIDLSEMESLYWEQTSGTDNELCAPTDEEFQDWLATLDDAEGPDCPETSGYIAKSDGQPYIQHLAVTSQPGPDNVYSEGEDIEVKVSFN